MKRSRLTALEVQRAYSAGKPVILCDGDGLYLRKQNEYSASWVLRYTYAGRAHSMTLGNYPDMTLAQARIEARQGRVMLDKQQDPLGERRKVLVAERQRCTFKQLCEDWYQGEVLGHQMKHPDVPRRYLDNHLVPKLGKFTAADVTPADIARILDKLKGRAPTAASDNFIAIKLLLALCVRKGELLAARWDEFDIDGATQLGAVWHLPADRTKTGEQLDIPLVPEVVEWLKAIRMIGAGSDFVFPKRRLDRRNRVPHMGSDTLNVAMARVKHELQHFTIHDLRRTARTHLAALGVRREVAERCLGHKLPGVEGTYNRHDYFKERREALRLWTEVLLQVERGECNVVQIDHARRTAHEIMGR